MSNENPPGQESPGLDGSSVSVDDGLLACPDCHHEFEDHSPLDETVTCPGCGEEIPVFEARHHYIEIRDGWRVWVDVDVPDEIDQIARLRLEEYGTEYFATLVDLLRPVYDFDDHDDG